MSRWQCPPASGVPPLRPRWARRARPAWSRRGAGSVRLGDPQSRRADAQLVIAGAPSGRTREGRYMSRPATPVRRCSGEPVVRIAPTAEGSVADRREGGAAQRPRQGQQSVVCRSILGFRRKCRGYPCVRSRRRTKRLLAKLVSGSDAHRVPAPVFGEPVDDAGRCQDMLVGDQQARAVADGPPQVIVIDLEAADPSIRISSAIRRWTGRGLGASSAIQRCTSL